MAKSVVHSPGVDDATERTLRAWKAVPHFKVELLEAFLRRPARKPLSPADKQKIIDQAILMFEHLYPHMPFKREVFRFRAIAPIERLNHSVRPILNSIGENDFHYQMIDAFSMIRDAHTLYGGPDPYRDAVAFLPFQLRYYRESDHLAARYIVTKIMREFDHPQFCSGAEITKVGGSPVHNYLGALANSLPGGNQAAIETRGALQSTLCPLAFCVPPRLDGGSLATFEYISPGSTETRTIQIPWGVATGIDAQHAFPHNSFSLSVAQVRSSAVADVLHPRPRAGSAAATPPVAPLSPAAAALSQPSRVPEVFEMAFTGGSVKVGSVDPANLVPSAGASGTERFGYIKIKSFSDGSELGTADSIVTEFQRILELMDRVAPGGLILDIRRNPGGDLAAAERMLQMLTPGEISPARFHLANTSAVLSILGKLSELKRDHRGLSDGDKKKLVDALAALSPWLGDAGNLPMPRGERLTSGQTLTSPAEANQVGQIYQGPVTLLIDALTYSAAEVFASGFQDHGIGLVIGADPNTGGGGANVWAHQDLLDKFGPGGLFKIFKQDFTADGDPGGSIDLKLEDLPSGATMSIALRRYSRVGKFNGQWVEDIGIRADRQYVPRSPADVISGNPGLLHLACDALSEAKKTRVDVTQLAVQRNGGVKLEVATVNLDSLSFFLDGHLVLEKQSVSRGKGNAVSKHSFTVPAAPGNSSPDLLRITGFTLEKGVSGTQPSLGAVRRVALKKPPEPQALPALPGLGSNPGGLISDL